MEIVAVVAGLIGVILGDRLAYFRERVGRKHGFVRQQVEEFYSPMVGLRQEVLAKSQLRKKISDAANTVWRALCTDKSVEELRALEADRFPSFRRIIEYDNKQLAEELLPSYRQMLELFRKRYWLANESTRQLYGALVEFVEIWNRWEQDSVPWEVVEELNHSEEPVKALYEELESQLDVLRTTIAKGKA